MPKNISQNVGSSKIQRTGHTTNGKNGSDPQAKSPSRPAVRELRP